MNRVTASLIAVVVVVVVAFATGFLSLGLDNNHGAIFLKITLVGGSLVALLGARVLLRNVVDQVHGAYPESTGDHKEIKAFVTKLHRGIEALVAIAVVAILAIVLFV
jgi:hypothetical protein